jgi:exosome complex RNA-binding protein Csl4
MSAESSAILQIVKDNGSLAFDAERLALSTCYAIRDLIRANILSNNNNTLTLCTA